MPSLKSVCRQIGVPSPGRWSALVLMVQKWRQIAVSTLPQEENDDWKYGHGNPTLDQFKSETGLEGEDWPMVLQNVRNAKDGAAQADSLWNAMDENERLKREAAEAGALYVNVRDKLKGIEGRHQADLEKAGAELEQVRREHRREVGDLETKEARLVNQFHDLQTKLRIAESLLYSYTVRYRWKLTVEHCETPRWKRYVEGRGWLTSGPHEFAVSPPEPKGDELFDGRVVDEDGNVIYAGREQNLMKLGITAADVGKSVIVETNDEHAIPSRLGILARGGHWAQRRVYGMPGGYLRDRVRQYGDVLRFDMRPMVDDRRYQFGDAAIRFELLER